jgi:hypothetical protein
LPFTFRLYTFQVIILLSIIKYPDEMTDPITMPEELLIAIGSETKEFIVKGTRLRPVKGSFTQLIIGIIWVGGFLWIGYAVFDPFGGAQETVVTPSLTNESLIDNLINQGIAGYLIYALFLIPGIWNLTKTVIPLLKKGGIFVGTPKNLLNYRNGKLITYEWNQFIQKTSATGNASKGNLTLTRTTGYQTKRNQAGMSYYIPYIVFMSGIPDVFEIEKICKQRIKESDTLFPT